MLTFHFGNQSLHLACPTLAMWLLTTIPSAAQEVVELPAEDRWLDAGFEEVEGRALGNQGYPYPYVVTARKPA